MERHADACAPEDHDAAVERELAELGKAIGDSVSNSTEASKQCIIEGFLLLHYKGQYSLSPGSDSEAALGITEHVVANFFNRIGRVVEHGEQVFPFGGYFNAFREDGFSKAAVTELREVVRTQLCGGRHGVALHKDEAGITKNCTTFRKWFTSSAGQKSDCYKMLRAAVVKRLMAWCAAQYKPGGRLYYAQQRQNRPAPSAADFKVRWLPETTLHAVLYRVLSPSTEKWLKNQSSDGAILNLAKGFQSENDELTGLAGIYSGNYILQLGKSLSMALRALNKGVDVTELPRARRARFLAVKNATRRHKWRAWAVTDDVFCDAVASLDLRYAWDATLFGAMCDAETLALRRVEVYQQDHGDCKFEKDGEVVTLPHTKADQQAEGITRKKSAQQELPIQM